MMEEAKRAIGELYLALVNAKSEIQRLTQENATLKQQLTPTEDKA